MWRATYQRAKGADAAYSLASWIRDGIFLLFGLTGASVMAWAASQIQAFWNTFHWFGVLFVGLIAWLFIGIGLNLFRQSRVERVDPFLVIAGIAALVLIASLVGYSLKSSAATPPPSSPPAESLAPTPAPQVEYLKNVRITYIQKTTSSESVYFSGDVNITTERLRFFVDYSWFLVSMQSFAKPQRVPLGEKKDLVRAQKIDAIPVIIIDREKDPTGEKIFWGDPRFNWPVGEANAARLVILGGDGREQHVYFEVTRTRQYSPSDVLVIQDLARRFRWVGDWQKEIP